MYLYIKLLFSVIYFASIHEPVVENRENFTIALDISGDTTYLFNHKKKFTLIIFFNSHYCRQCYEDLNILFKKYLNDSLYQCEMFLENEDNYMQNAYNYRLVKNYFPNAEVKFRLPAFSLDFKATSNDDFFEIYKVKNAPAILVGRTLNHTPIKYFSYHDIYDSRGSIKQEFLTALKELII